MYNVYKYKKKYLKIVLYYKYTNKKKYRNATVNECDVIYSVSIVERIVLFIDITA